MKQIALLLFGLFLILACTAQTPSISSQNMSSTASASTQGFRNRSFRVRFEIQNDSIVLIDSFITAQPLVDSFLHSNLQADTIYVDYQFTPSNSSSGPSYSCDYNDNPIDTIIQYSFKLFHKDSFQTKTVQYKENFYTLTSMGSPNFKFSPDVFDVDSAKVFIPISGGSIDFWVNQECPIGISVRQDSIFIQVASAGSSAPQAQLLKEFAYSSIDSFNLRLQVPCGNLHTLDTRYFCYEIFIGDTMSNTRLDVRMFSYNSNPAIGGGPNYWFHYERDSSGSNYYLTAPLAADRLVLNVQRINNANHLNWAILAEQNTSHFNILKSYNGVDYAQISTMPAARISAVPSVYYFDDLDIYNNGNLYYKVELIDIDFKKTSSNIVSVSANNKQAVSISPNPSNSIFQLNGLSNAYYRIKVVTLEGNTVFDKKIAIDNGSFSLHLNNQPIGIYLLSVRNLETGKNLIQKIIKKE